MEIVVIGLSPFEDLLRMPGLAPLEAVRPFIVTHPKRQIK
jgi:hypothetical protein